MSGTNGVNDPQEDALPDLPAGVSSIVIAAPDREVRTIAEWKQSRKDLRPLYKKARENFGKFIDHYNADKDRTLILDEKEKEALTKLHKMWKDATVNSIDDNIYYFHAMKDLHMVINTKHLHQDQVWSDYIFSVQAFRVNIQVVAFNLIKLREMGLAPNEQGSGFGSAAGGSSN